MNNFDPANTAQSLAVVEFSTTGFAEGVNSKRQKILSKNLELKSFAIKDFEGNKDDQEDYIANTMATYKKNLTDRSEHQLGYPCNLEYDYKNLNQLLCFPINNIGDPFTDGNFGIHSRPFEVGVLDWFAEFMKIEKNEYWGYVTSGGTEANHHGILTGRKMFPNGILYASKESHYSVAKAIDMFSMKWVQVETQVSGEIDYHDFKTKLLANKEFPAIVVANIGTTMKGAVDDIDLIIQTLKESGFSQNRFYIHCDGALSGIILPFMTCEEKVISFKKPIGSASISGHKFIGCPITCGILITRKDYINFHSRNIEYIAPRDATIMGSRNGHAPIFLWQALNKGGYKWIQKQVEECLKNARYLKECLSKARISAMLNEGSIIVVLERPKDEEFIRKWQLACQGNISHVLLMPHVSVEMLNTFLDELIAKRLTWYKDESILPPCLEVDIGKENCACALHKC
ncbi:hypothetical protein SLEP1_g39709 [Rubroshorea leprosula]|uniref:Histidine decarboxylase n=1 Tax=Rubroshorea leprosula TaxID=152421 RepID=A0AAV5L1A7_9ROSI|nr:hypothetical protein SLEP1_g39709 [Rubroshorea leprosula]